MRKTKVQSYRINSRTIIIHLSIRISELVKLNYEEKKKWFFDQLFTCVKNLINKTNENKIKNY